jgi:hypothetical protein
MPTADVQPNRPTKEQVEAFLAELAQPADGLEGADAVAANLAKLGIRGKRSDYIGCPVARALSQKFGLRFTAYSIYTNIPGTAVAATVFVFLPPPIREFIDKFDTGLGSYPELESQ